MKNKIIIISILFTLTIGAYCFAAPLDLPKQKIGNTEFYVYVVKKKETIYGICKFLNISKDDILKYNPSISEGLKKDQKLFFPVADFAEPQKKVKEVSIPDKFHHLVERGETLYGLSKTYNISQEDIISANPAARDGVKAGQILVIPQTTAKAEPSEQDAAALIYHTVKKGDTLFNLSQKYSTSIESILSLNPGVSPTNFKINDVIKIQPNIVIAQDIPQPKTQVEFFSYQIKNKETLESIADDYGVTVQELKQANPDVKEFKKGVYIYIPKIDRPVKIDESERAAKELDKVKVIYDSLKNDNKKSIDIALILPYMLNTTKPDKQALLYTEFYKGFLLAVDSIRKIDKRKINIRTYDTENSVSKVENILSNPDLKKIDFIFAPDETAQMQLICDFAKENKINVINTFIIKNDAYTTNDNFYQVNVPHSYMFAKVFDEFNDLFKDREVIFVSQSGWNTEEKDILPELRDYLKDHKNIKTHKLIFDKNLSIENIDSITSLGNKYIIIPTDASKKFLSKISIALKKSKTEIPDKDIILFGFPEWTTYFNEYKDTFKVIDTYIYTRFFVDTESTQYKDFNSLYKKWYGENMIYATPQFGLLGFDTGMFFLTLNGNNSTEPLRYNGIQNDFLFERASNWGGFINKSLYFIHLSPNNEIQKISK